MRELHYAALPNSVTGKLLIAFLVLYVVLQHDHEVVCVSNEIKCLFVRMNIELWYCDFMSKQELCCIS